MIASYYQLRLSAEMFSEDDEEEEEEVFGPYTLGKSFLVKDGYSFAMVSTIEERLWCFECARWECIHIRRINRHG